jgi:hypothetical protein
MLKKRLLIKYYQFMEFIFGAQPRCKKNEPLKPMGIRSSYYPPDYKMPIERVYSDGTKEYLLPIETQQTIHNSIEQMKSKSFDNE